jgi:hypothetical protein
MRSVNKTKKFILTDVAITFQYARNRRLWYIWRQLQSSPHSSSVASKDRVSSIKYSSKPLRNHFHSFWPQTGAAAEDSRRQVWASWPACQQAHQAGPNEAPYRSEDTSWCPLMPQRTSTSQLLCMPGWSWESSSATAKQQRMGLYPECLTAGATGERSCWEQVSSILLDKSSTAVVFRYFIAAVRRAAVLSMTCCSL